MFRIRLITTRVFDSFFLQVSVKANYNVSIGVSLYTNPSSKCATCMTGTSQAERESAVTIITMLGLALMKKSVIQDSIFVSYLYIVFGNGASVIAPHYQPNSTSVAVSRLNQFSELDLPFTIEGITYMVLFCHAYYRLP